MARASMVFPKVEATQLTQNYGRFSIGPLESGYGVTLGNALRRVLLSSLAGAAITFIRVNGAYHEFSTIEHVKEDLVSLMLNLKGVRLLYRGDEPVRLSLHISSPGMVTAGDVECPPEVEIANPELYLCTVDSDEADLEMEMTVEKGRGYSPAEERGRLGPMEIPMDAVFSPIKRANFAIERERVEQLTNYDRLVMEIWTDGTVEPQEALTQSAQILLEHFSLIVGLEKAEVVAEAKEEGIPSHIYGVPIEDLGLQVRAYNCLKRAGITRVGEVLERLAQGEEHILSIRNFGRKSLDELYERLEEKGFYKRAGGGVEEAPAAPAGEPEAATAAEPEDIVTEEEGQP